MGTSKTATQAAIAAQDDEPRAVSVRYDEAENAVMLKLATGAIVGIPLGLIGELAGATAEHLAHLKLTPSGTGLSCRPLDADISIEGLLMDVIGARSWRRSAQAAWMREIAGSKSEAKAAASRVNGAKGGRPKTAKPAPAKPRAKAGTARVVQAVKYAGT